MEEILNQVQPIQTIISNIILFIPKLIVALIIFFVSLFVGRLGYNFVERSLKEREANSEITLLLARGTRITIIIFGTIWALATVDFDVTGFLAGLGIAGLTIGFALKDIAQNFVSGILILIQRPFQIGDAVEAAGVSGTIENIEIRSTTFRTWDGLLVIVPNAQVYSSAITNYSQVPQRRISVDVGVAYDTDLDRADQIMLDVAKQMPGIKNDPAPFVVFKEFGGSAINATLYFWVDMGEVDYFSSIDAVVKGIKKAFEHEKIDIPYPIRTLYLDSSSGAILTTNGVETRDREVADG